VTAAAASNPPFNKGSQVGTLPPPFFFVLSQFEQLVFSQRTTDPLKPGCTLGVARFDRRARAPHKACSCSCSNEGSPVGHVTNCDLAHAFVRMYLGADAVQPAVMIVVVTISILGYTFRTAGSHLPWHHQLLIICCRCRPLFAAARCRRRHLGPNYYFRRECACCLVKFSDLRFLKHRLGPCPLATAVRMRLLHRAKLHHVVALSGRSAGAASSPQTAHVQWPTFVRKHDAAVGGTCTGRRGHVWRCYREVVGGGQHCATQKRNSFTVMFLIKPSSRIPPPHPPLITSSPSSSSAPTKGSSHEQATGSSMPFVTPGYPCRAIASPTPTMREAVLNWCFGI
jgi:hypothetical protein